MISKRRIEFLLRDLKESVEAMSNAELSQFEDCIRKEKYLRMRRNTYF